MSRLRIFSDDAPQTPTLVIDQHENMATELARHGIRFEQWRADTDVATDASIEQITLAYRQQIDRLMGEAGYQSFDVISLHPEHPDRGALRQKFLSEHTHAEDEVRFFVAGSGLFTLHIGDQVLEILCERGDLIGVPAGTRHWFDMGPAPSFTAIRIFTNAAGWVANFTGETIAERFPRLEAA